MKPKVDRERDPQGNVIPLNNGYPMDDAADRRQSDVGAALMVLGLIVAMSFVGGLGVGYIIWG